MSESRTNHEDSLLLPIILAAIAFLAIGLLSYNLIPAATQQNIKATADLMLFPSKVRPEPKEKYTYFLLLLLTPTVAFGTTKALRNRAAVPVYYDMTFVTLAYIILISFVLRDRFWAHLLLMTDRKYLYWGAFVSLVVALLWPITRSAHCVTDRILKWLIFLVIALAGILEVATRVFGAQSVSYISDFYVHYDAAIYSISQITNGGSCLVDVFPQYGCYGEVLRPALKLLGGNTLATTITLGVLQGASFLMVSVYAYRIIRSRWLVLLAVLLLIPTTNRLWFGSGDQFFQGLPIRLLMPVCSLFVADFWARRESTKAACLTGLFSGLSVIWNLDTGAVIFVAMAGLLIFSGSTASGWSFRSTLKRRMHLCCYLLGTAASIALFTAEVRLRSGHWPNFYKYIAFQQLFFGSGAFMLPIASVASLWAAFVAAAGITLILLVSQIGRGPLDRRHEAVGYLSLLGLGLFSYHLGRSSPDTLALIAWPFILLILNLAEHAWNGRLRPFGWSSVTGRVALAIPMGAVVAIVLAGVPIAWSVTAQHYLQLRGIIEPEEAFSDTQYLKGKIMPGSRTAILAKDQSVFFSETKSRSAIVAPSLAETLTKADAENQLYQVLHPDFTDLYLGADVCCDLVSPTYPSFIADNMSLIKHRYALVDWSPNGTIAHLVPRERANGADDLFDYVPDTSGDNIVAEWDPLLNESVSRWQRPVKLSHRWSFSLGNKFRIDMQFVVDKIQPESVDVVRTMAGLSGFAVELNKGNIGYIFIGDDQTTLASDYFPIDPGLEHTMVLDNDSGHVVLMFDSKVVFDSGKFKMARSTVPLNMGEWYVSGRALNGTLKSLHISGDLENGLQHASSE